MNEKPKSTAEMGGEFCREAAVLIFVFEFFAKLYWPEAGPVDSAAVWKVFGIAAIFMVGGIALERYGRS